jgi:hypothetical protein
MSCDINWDKVWSWRLFVIIFAIFYIMGLVCVSILIETNNMESTLVGWTLGPLFFGAIIGSIISMLVMFITLCFIGGEWCIKRSTYTSV